MANIFACSRGLIHGALRAPTRADEKERRKVQRAREFILRVHGGQVVEVTGIAGGYFWLFLVALIHGALHAPTRANEKERRKVQRAREFILRVHGGQVVEVTGIAGGYFS